MAYKFQVGESRLSGSLIQEGQLNVYNDAGEEKFYVDTAGAVVADGSITAGTSFVIGSADLNETDLEKLDGITNGTAAASKALVLDGSKDASGINALGIASMASNWTNAGRTVADMGTVTTMDLNGGSIDGTIIGAASTAAASVTTLDVSADGQFAATLGATGSVSFGSTLDLTGIMSGSAAGKFQSLDVNNGALTVSSAGATVAAGSVTAVGSFIIGSADLSESDMEKLDGITDGTAAANKALVLDASSDISGINALGIASMASNWTNAGRTVADMGTVTTMDLNGGSIDGAVIGAASQAAAEFTTVSGSGAFQGGSTAVFASSVTAGSSFIIGSADLDETDLEKLDGITDGTAAASKALVLDGSKDVSGINALGIASMATNWTNASRTVADMGTVTTMDLNGGSIDGTAIGASVQAAAEFTTMSGSGALQVGDVSWFGGLIRPSVDDTIDLGAAANEFKDLYLDGVAYIDELQADQLGAALNANSQNITNVGTFEVDGAASFNGSVTLGDATGDDLTFTGRAASHLTPKTDSSFNLGSNSLRWDTIYVDNIVGADIALDTENYGAVPYGYTLSASVDFALLTTSDQTYTLPTAVAGKVVHVKLSGSISQCTVSAGSGDSLEGGSSVILESSGSAVTLVAMDATHWFIV